MSSLTERWTTGTNAEWMELDKKYHIQHRYTSPIALARGQGNYIWDVEGKRYIDFESGQSAAMLGHCHPKYVEVVREQVGTLLQTGSVFSPPSQILLAMKMEELLGKYGLNKAMFGVNGTDVTEQSLRLSKVYTGRFEVAAAWQGDHGATYGSRSIEGAGGFWEERTGPRMPGVIFFPNYPHCPDGSVDLIREAIGRTSSGKLAALVIEPIQGAGGINVPTKEWLQGVADIAREFEAVLVFDESHSGLGKTGKWFAFEHFDVVPDMILLGKGFGEIPCSGLVTTTEIGEKGAERGFFWSQAHQGDAGLMAMGLSAIEIIQSEKLVENAAEVGAYLTAGVQKLHDEHEIIGKPRGLGFMQGMHILQDKGTDKQRGFPEAAHALRDAFWERGLHVFYRPGVQFGFLRGDIIRLSPSLITTKEVVDEALNIMEDSLKEVEAKLL